MEGKLSKLGIRQFFFYSVIAAIATVIDFGSLFLITELLNVHYLISTVVAYFLGMTTNFSLNKVITFKNKSKRIVQQFGVFMIIASIGLALNIGIMYILTEYFGLWYMFSRFISAGVVLGYSYVGHKKITFEKYR